MESVKAIETVMCPSYKLNKDENHEDVNQKFYRGIISSLLYFTTSRSDIIFSICIYARFQSNPKEFYMLAIKRILRYLMGT